jgi:tetratricopeptide (TPR) repeat protein
MRIPTNRFLGSLPLKHERQARRPVLLGILTNRFLAACCVTIWALTCVSCARSPAAKEAKYLARGKEFLEKKDYARAIIEFRNASAAMPKDVEPWYQLGVASLGSKQTAQAIQSFRRATELNPKHASAELELSELMLASQQPEVLQNAVERLNQVLALEPENTDALDALALADLKLRKPDDALKPLQEALDKFPAHVKSSAMMAAVQYTKGDFAGAEETLKTAITRAPKSVEAVLALAQIYLLENKKTDAETQLELALQIDPASQTALISLGRLQLALGKTAGADHTYRALASLPGGNLSHAHAAFLLEQGKREEAIQELQQLAKAHPDDRPARLRLVAAYITAGRPQDARQYLAEILQKNPKDTNALLLRGRVNLDSGHLVEAEQDLQTVQHFLPNSADVHYGLSKIYALRGLTQNRLQELGEVLRINPNLLEIRAELAKVRLTGGQPQAALDVMEAAPRQEKTTVPFLVARNWALLALNRLDEAQAGIDQGLRVQKAPALLLQRGVLRAMKKDLSGARQDAEEVLGANPANLGAVNLAIETSLELKEPTAAFRILQETTAKNARSPQIQTFAGQWLRAIGKPAEAREAFQRAKGLNPQYTAADLGIAALDLQQGKIDAARTSLSAMIAKEPRNLRAQLILAGLEYSAKNLPAALTHFRAAVDLSPDNVTALNGEAYLVASQDPDSALKLAEHALDLSPGNPTVEDTLGWVYYRKGLYTKAVELLSQSVAKQPTATHQYHLAMSYMKIGDNVHASQNLQQALAKDPKVGESEMGR